MGGCHVRRSIGRCIGVTRVDAVRWTRERLWLLGRHAWTPNTKFPKRVTFDKFGEETIVTFVEPQHCSQKPHVMIHR